MPAKPRRLRVRLRDPEVRRVVEVRFEDARERLTFDRERVARVRVARAPTLDFDRLELERGRLEVERFERDLEVFRARCDFVSPFSRRILFTVRAATSSARPP